MGKKFGRKGELSGRRHHYAESRWNRDFVAYEFILDRKLPDKLSPMEKYLKSNLLLFLDDVPKTGTGEPFLYPDSWSVEHPFRATYMTREGLVDLKKVLGNLRFEDSATVPGLGAVHILANTLYHVWAATLPSECAHPAMMGP